MRRNFLRAYLAPVLFLALLVSIPAFAADTSCPEPRVPVSALLLPPPKQGSAETRAELQELLRLQESRTAAQAKHASGDHHRTVERFLGEIGIKVKELPPFASHFFDCLARTTEHEVHEAKAKFNRARPYKLPHNKLHILKTVGRDDSPSYPSGHAAYGMVAGLVLARMLPERKQEIFNRIEDFGYSRLVSGVHFRSDVYAGEIAGGAIVASLFENDAFRDAFARAKPELRKAVGY
jgi:acid phosphatase (class A)